MTTPVQLHPLQHREALTRGRVHLQRGEHVAVVTEEGLRALLKRATSPRSVTGTVKTDGVALDESELQHLLAVYFPQTQVHGFDEDEVEVGPFTDRNGWDRTPGYQPTKSAM